METETKQRHRETNRSYELIEIITHTHTHTQTHTHTHKTFYFETKDYTSFSALHGTFSKTDHIVCHKTDFNRYNNIEIIPCNPIRTPWTKAGLQ